MSIETQFEREETAIWEAVERGDLDQKEAWKQQIELQRDYAQAARDSAQEAYDRELERW